METSSSYSTSQGAFTPGAVPGRAPRHAKVTRLREELRVRTKLSDPGLSAGLTAVTSGPQKRTRLKLSVIGMAAAVGGIGVLAFQSVAPPAPAVTPGSETTARTAKVAPLEYDEAHFQATLATLDTQVFSVRPPERAHHQGAAPASRIKTDRMTVRQVPDVASMDMPNAVYRVASMDAPSVTYRVESMDMPNA